VLIRVLLQFDLASFVLTLVVVVINKVFFPNNSPTLKHMIYLTVSLNNLFIFFVITSLPELNKHSNSADVAKIAK